MNEDDYCMFNVHGVWTDGDGHDWWCWTGWHCLATTIHTNETEDEQVTCWSDYLCIFINH